MESDKLDKHLDWHLRAPFWRSERVFGESLFFIKEPDSKHASAQLLFKPDNSLQIISSSRETVYTQNLDYVIDSNTRTVTLTDNSRIPFTEKPDLYPGIKQENSIAHKYDDDETGILFGEDHYFHDLQVEASYGHNSTWQGSIPEFHGNLLPATINKIKVGDPLKICLCGDSISAGANASGCYDTKPCMAPYPDLFAEELRSLHGGEVVLKNFAVGGKGIEHGVEVSDKMFEENPDLVLIAYGMNDVGSKTVAQYMSYITQIIDLIKTHNPKTEIILIASMLGNAEWHHTPSEPFFIFRDALKSLCKEGLVLADLTQLWSELLKFKSFHDLTGNGVNHPNDFGHRIYAQVLLDLLLGVNT